MPPLYRRSLVFAGLTLVLAVAFWAVTPPRGIDDYARGAPVDWARLREIVARGPPARLRRAYVPRERISVDLQLAIVLGEDADFFGHGAWDPAAVREALRDWWRGGRLRGASTLSQQLAKNLFLSNERSLWRKLREARYAYWLEDRLGKLRILELYLNVVELGDGVIGVESGSRHYFGVPAAVLDGDRAAQLAAAIPSPLKHNPATRTAAWWTRYRAIIGRMERLGWLRGQLGGAVGPDPRERAGPGAADPSAGTAESPAGEDRGPPERPARVDEAPPATTAPAPAPAGGTRAAPDTQAEDGIPRDKEP